MPLARNARTAGTRTGRAEAPSQFRMNRLNHNMFSVRQFRTTRPAAATFGTPFV
jgi:hypothetical protein